MTMASDAYEASEFVRAGRWDKRGRQIAGEVDRSGLGEMGDDAFVERLEETRAKSTAATIFSRYAQRPDRADP